MSESPETDFDLDLHFLPAWAQKSADPNRYAKYAGETPRDDRKDRGERRPFPRPNRDRERSGPRPQQDRPRSGRRPDDRQRPDERPRRDQAPPPPLPELNVAFKPDD